MKKINSKGLPVTKLMPIYYQCKLIAIRKKTYHLPVILLFQLRIL